MLPLLTKAVEHHYPVGVVGIIAPRNYPLTLAVSDAIPALLAGNSVVLKPSEETPFTALLAVSLFREAGLPEDVLQVVTGHGSTIGPPLIEQSNFLMFTGSIETGKTVARQAGANLTKCSMELGGKNPLVVFDDADLAKATEGAIRGCFTNAGQLCISLERCYAQSSVRDEFERRFVAAVEDLELGTSLDYGPDVGSLASADQLEKVKSHVADAREKGATVLTGGEARPDVGPYFYEPTVLADVTPDMTVASGETFGPVVALYEFDSTRGAIERANDSDRGLNASVWTADSERGHAVAERVECGTVSINEAYIAAWGSLDAPMGWDEGVGTRPASRPGGHPEVHRIPDGRRTARGPARRAAWRPRTSLREGDDGRAARDEADSWASVRPQVTALRRFRCEQRDAFVPGPRNFCRA